MSSPEGHWFWWLLTMACLVWYIAMTAYVAVSGVFDIKDMLRRLAERGRPGITDAGDEAASGAANQFSERNLDR